MKFLVIAQDLRISGTSEGIVSRSFIAKLRIAYPKSVIDVLYLKHHPSEDRLDLLPVNSIEIHLLKLKIPFHIYWFNKLYWRLFHTSLSQEYVHNQYAYFIKNKNTDTYDHIFVRSSGLDFEIILALEKTKILEKAIINFHDPYPVFWNTGSNKDITNLELFKFKKMLKIVKEAKVCMSPAKLLSQDMAHLYGSTKEFYVLPHQYSESVFDFSDRIKKDEKSDKIIISYHGAIQFSRNVDILLDAYSELIEEDIAIKEKTEFILRLRGSHNKRLIEKYKIHTTIKILDELNFSQSSYEQMTNGSILILLEDCSTHSNILVGKAPFLASLQKPVLSISPNRSELQEIIKDKKYIAKYYDKHEIKVKLYELIKDRLQSKEKLHPFGDYFSDENFKIMLDKILNCSTVV